MLHNLFCSNMFSIGEEVELNFSLNKSDRFDDTSAIEAGERVGKVLMISGHNASGKTNLLKVLSFLNWFVFSSFKELDPDQEIPFQPHFFTEKSSSEVEITFGAGGDLYRYFLKLNKSRVLEEELHKRSSETHKYNYLFKREWDSKAKKYKLSQAGFGFNQRGVSLRENASFLAQALHHGVEHAKEIKEKIYVFSNVNFLNRAPSLTGLLPVIDSASEFFHNDECYFGLAKKFFASLDLGVDDFVIEKQKNVIQGVNKKTIYVPYGIHKQDGKKIKQHLSYESTGTQMIFALSADIMQALDNGGVAIIDELDSDLHPDTVSSIVNLFIHPSTNPNNAQLIFTSHNHEVMNKLTKKQIVLVEKNDHDTDAWLLSDVEDVRADDNFYKKYRSGAYNAVGDLTSYE